MLAGCGSGDAGAGCEHFVLRPGVWAAARTGVRDGKASPRQLLAARIVRCRTLVGAPQQRVRRLLGTPAERIGRTVDDPETWSYDTAPNADPLLGAGSSLSILFDRRGKVLAATG